MNWEFLNIIGTIAFVLSGAIMASEEEYDLIGFYALGFTAAFGGGLFRNLIIGVPASVFWNQQTLFLISFLLITLIYLIPIDLITRTKHWFYVYGLLDAIGLSAFAIQGGLIAKNMGLPASAIIVSSLLTGVGGGIIRDTLAKRQPFVFKYDLYAFWAILVGIILTTNIPLSAMNVILLFLLIIALRMLSLIYSWKIPRSTYIEFMKRRKTNV